jgi:predicted dehydrogenase
MEGRLDVQLSTTWAALGEERFDFSVYGTEGELHFDAANKLTGAFLSHRGTVKPISVSGVIPEEEENRTTIFKGSFVYFARQIVEAVLTQSCEPVVDAATFEDAIPVQEVLEAIRTSALEGNTVKMNDGYEPGARY